MSGVTYHMSYVLFFVIQIVVTFEPKQAILISSAIVISEKNADKLYLMKKYWPSNRLGIMYHLLRSNRHAHIASPRLNRPWAKFRKDPQLKKKKIFFLPLLTMTNSASPLSVGGEHGIYISQPSNLLGKMSDPKKITDIRHGKCLKLYLSRIVCFQILPKSAQIKSILKTRQNSVI